MERKTQSVQQQNECTANECICIDSATGNRDHVRTQFFAVALKHVVFSVYFGFCVDAVAIAGLMSAMVVGLS